MASETTTCIKAVSKVDEVNIQEAERLGEPGGSPRLTQKWTGQPETPSGPLAWGRPLEFEVQWVHV